MRVIEKLVASLDDCERDALKIISKIHCDGVACVDCPINIVKERDTTSFICLATLCGRILERECCND